MSYYDQVRRQSLSDRLMSAAKRRPEAVLLFAAGCALLLSGKSSTLRRAASAGRDYYSSAVDASDSWRGAAADQAAEVGHRLQDVSQRAQSFIGDLADRALETTSHLGDTASSYASQVSGYATSARDQAGEQVGKARTFAQTNLEHMLTDQPIALGLLGLAAGAALGAALPETDMENRTLGVQRDQLAKMAKQTATDQIEQLKSSAGQVGERVMNAVKENGLSADGLKQTATDIAAAFEGQKPEDADKSRPSTSSANATGGKSSATTNKA